MSCREGDARCGAAVAACTAARAEHPTIKEAGSKPGPRQHLCPEGVQGWRKEGEYRVAAWWAHTHTGMLWTYIHTSTQTTVWSWESSARLHTPPPLLARCCLWRLTLWTSSGNWVFAPGSDGIETTRSGQLYPHTYKPHQRPRWSKGLFIKS